MAVATMESMAVAIEPKIKMAMENIGLGERADDLLDMLDEIELNRRLKISMEQFKRGESRPAREALKEVRNRVLNG